MSKKFLVCFAMIAMLFVAMSLSAVAQEVQLVNFEGAGFHCNHGTGTGNGSVKIDGWDNKTRVVLERVDDTTWILVGKVDGTPAPECPVCGGDEWISFSNKSGVPNGKNIQLNCQGPAVSEPDPGDPVILSFEDLKDVEKEYCRYRAYVQLWNDLDQEDPSLRGIPAFLDGALDHYFALLAEFGAESLPPYWHFDFDNIEVFEYWADALEVGFIELGYSEEDLYEIVLDFFADEGLGLFQ